MKSKKIIITTIILMIVVFYSLSLPVMAYELGGNGEYSIDKLQSITFYSSSTGTMSVSGAVLSPTPWEGASVVSSQPLSNQFYFDKYINFRYANDQDPADYPFPGGIGNPHFNIVVRSDALNESGHVFDINTISFTFGMIGFYGQTTSDDIGMQIVVVQKDGTLLSNNMSYSYEFGTAVAGTTQLGDEYFYRPIACTAHLDSGLKFDNESKIAVLVRSYALFAENNGTPHTFLYSLGMTPLYVTWKTDEEYVAGIGSNISNMDKTLTDISDTLNTSLTPAQQQRLDQVSQQITSARENSAVIDSVIEDLANDVSFDFEINDFDTALRENIGPIYVDSGFNSFWEFLWNNNFILSCILLVVTFVTLHYIIFGVT